MLELATLPNIIFTVLILALFVAAILLPRLRAPAPSLLIMLGLLGTFVGIFIGLADFDLQNLNLSIANLMQGVQTAFALSILGISAALLLRIKLTICPRCCNSEEKEITAEDLYFVLTEIKQAITSAGLSKDLEAQLANSVAEQQKVLQEQTGQLKTLLEKDLSDALGQLGDKLSSLSDKFVEDYKPLTEKLATLVKISEKVEGAQ
ncbi:MAG: MotA/TolQ/ExbB proton channel family protein [Alphaproteobacteria bacterium]